MKKTLSILLALGLVAGTYITAHAQDNRRSITVTGTSEISVPSDLAIMRISVTTQSKSADEAVKENAIKMNAVKVALQKEGFSKESLKTDNYRLYKTNKYDEKDKDEMETYEAVHTIKVKTEDLQKTGMIIDAATNAGATDIDSLSFTLKDSKKYQSQALANAILDAKSKAETIAKTLHKKIINIISVSEGSVDINPYNFRSKMLAADMGSTSIESGETHVSGEITVVFEIG
ncbi:SIMPL domain-containing protein [Dialister micraerophilus]|jgi:hypothetical protein|uniref:Uncharacterized protein n=1 Tax=Dialister micraerophilus UPII 345-E TaxID=910314 RepID=E4L7D8_9FIRM|nr:SIMPL domain-containing protein [Dialister micraerophilus]EFR43345.1 hypothetical protein HMPREF9220_1287 [Dialister micraerophilus UPII 345-E]